MSDDMSQSQKVEQIAQREASAPAPCPSDMDFTYGEGTKECRQFRGEFRADTD